MSNTAPISAIPPDVAPALPAPATTPAAVGNSQTPPTQSDAQADLRLVIEEDKAAGSYVYITVDPTTGKVISQLPREQLLKMREASDYKPGTIVDSRS
jgi:hypothetical protein